MRWWSSWGRPPRRRRSPRPRSGRESCCGIPATLLAATGTGWVFCPRARTLLGWIQGTYAVAPSQASLPFHALDTMHYVNGAWYPQGGGGVISDRLADVVSGNGGQFLLRHEATQITLDDGRVTGVVAADPNGETVTVSASTVVAAGDIRQTFLSLLDPAAVPRKLVLGCAATRWLCRRPFCTWSSSATWPLKASPPRTSWWSPRMTCRACSTRPAAGSSPTSRSSGSPLPA